MSLTVSSSQSNTRAAFAAARDLCRRADGAALQAYRCGFFLPRNKREAICAIAAFDGLILQAINSGSGSGGGGSSGGGCCSGSDGVTAAVKSRIDALYADPIELPLPEYRDPSQWTFAAMAEVVKRFEIPRACLHDFADGLAADRKVQRYATWNALRRHCELVGGSVARMVACVLGVTHSDGAMFAGKIGVATRLVQILRNFGRDPSRGDNLYFPLEELVRYKCLRAMESPSVGRLDHGVVSEEAHRFADFSRFQVERAREFLREGSEGLCWLAGDGSRMAAAMFVTRQMGKLDALEECEMNPTRATKRDRWPSRRLRHLSNAWRLARRTPDEPLPRVG